MPNLLDVVKRLVSRWPESWQMALRRYRYRWLILTHRFAADEPEFARLSDWVGQGDWVVDVGANIGHYTIALARLVGRTGRVIALEPISQTFQLLTRHVGGLDGANVTLLNVAASDRCRVVDMEVPRLESGLDNLYQSRIASGGRFAVLAVPLDALLVDRPIRLIKVDVEGHEMSVLQGAIRLIERDRPVLILESDIEEFSELLGPLGYRRKRFDGSPNTVYLPD